MLEPFDRPTDCLTGEVIIVRNLVLIDAQVQQRRYTRQIQNVFQAHM